MYTASELALLRKMAPGSLLPGIDTLAGDAIPLTSLAPLSALASSYMLAQKSNRGFYYIASENEVIVNTAGAVLEGYNFGDATVVIQANNVTIKNCNFSVGSAEWYCVQQAATVKGATIQNCTFDGGNGSTPSRLGAFITASTAITVLNNKFLNAPGDAVDLQAGTVSGNYFSGAGYSSAGSHPDAVWVGGTTGPVTISNNFIDWTWASQGATLSTGQTNDAIRITTELGNTSNVTVSGNYLLGGSNTIDAGNRGSGVFTNISITGNYLGFGQYGAFYGGPQRGVTSSGNIIVDFTNPLYSTQAWIAYWSAGLKTQQYVAASSAGQTIVAKPSVSTTLYGGGYRGWMTGSSALTVFIGGADVQYIWGGTGENIVTYLAMSDSTVQAPDGIGNFDVNKDVIDLSAISASIGGSGPQNFAFIGTASFSGSGAQVRYEWDAKNNQTLVEATLYGDKQIDFETRVDGLVTLTAANFALTASQSAADISAAAALRHTLTSTVSGAYESQYMNVQGRTYSSFSEIYSASRTLAVTAYDNIDRSGTLQINTSALTVTKGYNSLSVAVGNNSFTLTSHTNESILATGGSRETFVFNPGYGQATIQGFAAVDGDRLQLATSSFSYLNRGMTQAQEFAALLSHSTSTNSGLIITDSLGDQLTLLGPSQTLAISNVTFV